MGSVAEQGVGVSAVYSGVPEHSPLELVQTLLEQLYETGRVPEYGFHGLAYMIRGLREKGVDIPIQEEWTHSLSQ